MANILVVEDDPRMLDALVWLVESEGHRVAQARNGVEALALARSEPPDLVVTDYMMPLMDGLELAKALAEDPGFRLSRWYSPRRSRRLPIQVPFWPSCASPSQRPGSSN